MAVSNDVFASIVGVSVRDKNTDYGKVVEVRKVEIDNTSVILAISSCGKAMRMTTLIKLLESQNLFVQVDSDDNYIVIAYPDGSDYSKRTFGSKAKRRTNLYPGGFINTLAQIKGERIDITTYVCSNPNTKVNINS